MHDSLFPVFRQFLSTVPHHNINHFNIFYYSYYLHYTVLSVCIKYVHNCNYNMSYPNMITNIACSK